MNMFTRVAERHDLHTCAWKLAMTTLTLPLLGIVAPASATSATLPPSVAPVQAHLTVLPSDEKPDLTHSAPADKPAKVNGQPQAIQLALADGVYDFGQISTLLTSRLNHTFVLRNDTKMPMTVQQVQTSCGCTRATLGDKPLPLSLAPGQNVSLKVSLDATQMGLGEASKYIWVCAKEQNAPVATLAVTGQVAPEFEVTPKALDFGAVVAGQNRLLTLTVRLTLPLVAAGITPHLSGAPNFIVVPETDAAAPVPAELSTGTQVAVSQLAQPANSPAVTHRYRVTLSPLARPGTLKGNIMVSLTQAGAAGSKYLAVILVPVSGQVNASPQTAASSPAKASGK